MKTIELIGILLMALICHTQPPGTFANSYPVSDKLGLTDGNWIRMVQRDDGSILCQTNNRNYLLMYSNSYTPLVYSQEVLQHTDNSNVTSCSNDGVWFVGNGASYLFKLVGDRFVTSAFQSPGTAYLCLQKGTLFQPKAASSIATYFTGQLLKTIKPI